MGLQYNSPRILDDAEVTTTPARKNESHRNQRHNINSIPSRAVRVMVMGAATSCEMVGAYRLAAYLVQSDWPKVPASKKNIRYKPFLRRFSAYIPMSPKWT